MGSCAPLGAPFFTIMENFVQAAHPVHDRQRLRGQRHAVLNPHLHALGRDRPVRITFYLARPMQRRSSAGPRRKDADAHPPPFTTRRKEKGRGRRAPSFSSNRSSR